MYLQLLRIRKETLPLEIFQWKSLFEGLLILFIKIAPYYCKSNGGGNYARI